MPLKKRKGESQEARHKRITKNKLWEALKTYIRIRDRNKCQKCGKNVKGQSAQTCHIIGRGQSARLKFSSLNLILMCPACHRWWHASPTESGMWFIVKFKTQWLYIQEMRSINGTLPVWWYEEKLEMVNSLIEIGES